MAEMSTEQRLVYMANQIARNLQAEGEEAAILATADHIAAFWDPRMKERIFAHAGRADGGLSPIADQAIRRLIARGAPAPQSHATEFCAVDETGRSDAG
jgi:formate dehydrogenase subunit delta